jgi:hypothetical protein
MEGGPDALRVALTELAELVLPRLPAGPSPEDVARLKGLIPEAIGGLPVDVQAFSGELFLGFGDPDDPNVRALDDALAAQGLTGADILVVGGGVEAEEKPESDYAVLLVQFKDVDATSLLLPFVKGAIPGASTAEITTAEVGGKQVTVIASDPVIHAYATGDLLALVNGPDDFLAAFFASLPRAGTDGASPRG